MTEHTSDELSNTTPRTSAINQQSKKQRIRSNNDIVGRTQLSLPSLSGLEWPTSASPSGKQESPPSISGSDRQKEITSPGILPETWEPGKHLPGVFKIVEETDVKADFFSAVTETEIPNLIGQQPQEPGISAFYPSIPGTRAEDQIISPIHKKRRYSFLFLLIALLCVLTLGTFVYANVYATPTGKKAIMAGKRVIGKKATPLQVQIKQQQPGTTLAPGTRSLQVSGSPSLTIQGYGGNVTIHPGNEGTIVIASSIDGSSQEANITINQMLDRHQHDMITVSPEPLSKHINYDITVPASAQVHVIIASGSISVAGVSGVTIQTTNGSLIVKDVNGPLKIHTVNGDITAHNITGQMSMETTNGSIRTDTVSGQLKATTQNGDIIIQQGQLHGQSALQTMYGSIRLTGALNPQGIYTLKTKSGDIILVLPANSAIQLYGTTGSGSIFNVFGNANIGNAPRAQIIASTGSGSVRVSQAGV